MSTGSQNIIIQVQDGVNPNIAVKIAAIGVAAEQSAKNLLLLQGALNNVNGGTANLSTILQQLTPRLSATQQGTSRLEGAFAQLAGRVVGMEAGLGMLGSALGRVGVAAGAAGPLIAGALAVGAVVGAVLAWEKYTEQQLKIEQAQNNVKRTSRDLNDALLSQEETLTGLTEGTLAKYAQELRDLPLKSIKTDLQDLQKEWTTQDSFWNIGLDKVNAFVERLADASIALAKSGGNVGAAALNIGAALSSDQGFDAAKFLADEEKKRQSISQTTALSKEQSEQLARDAKLVQDQFKVDQFEKLKTELVDIDSKIKELNATAEGQSGGLRAGTEEAARRLGEVYERDLQSYSKYLQDKKDLQAGADGALLAELRKAAEEELRQFNDDANRLKNSSGIISPQQTLALRQAQLAQVDSEHPGATNQTSPFAQERNTLVKDVGNAQQAIDRQNRSLDELVQKYQDEIQASGAYSVALKTEVEQRKAAAEIQRIAPDNQNAGAALSAINASVAAKVKDAETVKQQTAIYQQFEGPLLRYNAAIEASQRLLASGAISADKAAIADAQASRAKEDALHPLNEYIIGLEHEVALFGQHGTALLAVTEVDRIRQELLKQGRDLTTQESDQLKIFLEQLERQRELQADINNLYEQNAGAIEKLLIQQQVLNIAKSKGIISENQYQIATANVNIALANQALLEGKIATLQNQLVAGLGKYLQGYQGLAKGISDSYGQAFATIADGVANSLGRAIAYAENLGDALKNVARQAVSELLSSFIKLGIQWVETEILGHTVGAAALAGTIAEAGAAASAWAPAAAFASLATLGANAAPASASIAGTLTLTEALAAVSSRFAQGGIVEGLSGDDQILARLTRGEFVVKTSAVANNRQLLEQINSGTVNSNSSSSSRSATSIQVSVIHDGSTSIKVEKSQDNRIRIIAQQEARAAVEKHTPLTVASDLQNPNSRISRALIQNTELKRRR